MKNPFTLPNSEALLHAAQSALFGFGAAYPLLLALDMPVGASVCAMCSVASALAYLLLCCVKGIQWLFYPLLMLGMLAPFFPHRMQLAALGNALTLFLSGQPLALAAYAQPVAILISLMTAGIGMSLARSGSSFFPTVMLAIAVLFAVSFSGAPVTAAALLPLTLALLLSARARHVTLLRMLPSAVMVFVLTLALLPMAGSTVSAFEEAAVRVRQAIDDYLFFNDARTAFSLSSTGYQPLGSDRLGGPVAPADTPVMQVETAGRTLLRGVVKNEYTGLAWRDSTPPRRYLFVNPRFRQLKDDLFDYSRPAGALRGQLPDYETISVSMRADASSTLYLTQRFDAPKGKGIVAYFSPSGELFATHSLMMGESYAFSGMRLTSETPGVRNLVLASLDPQDPWLDDVQKLYLTLPQSVGQDVSALAGEICARLDNDYDRAAAICMYLQNSYPYTLLQSEPPVNRDFVTWFLFEEKRGYCTSFASAMAVMCRAVGIPARYIEGYAAVPDADGVARVTQEHGHAWVEAYFPGFGWLSFDPTPGMGQTPDTAPHTDGQDNSPQGEDLPEPSAPEEDPKTPEPTLEPTPTPSPTILPTPTPEHHDLAVTPTPPITPTPEITSAPTPQSTPNPTRPPEEPPKKDHGVFALLMILLLFVLVLLTSWRLYAAAPRNAAARTKTANDALLIWYAAIEAALASLGFAAAAGEPPATFLNRVQEKLGNEKEFMRLGRSVCTARYSRHKLGPKQVEQAQRVYGIIIMRMTHGQKLGMYAKRMIQGTRMYR